MHKRILICLLLLVLFILPPVALADYPDNFDYYTPTSINPGPWTFTYTPANSNCFIGQVLQNQYAFSPPNAYEITKAGSCYTQASTATFSLSINASSPFVYLIWEQSIQSGGVPQSGIATVSITSNGTVASTYDLNTITSTWSKAIVSFSLQVGKVYTLGFLISDKGYSTTYSYTYAIDSVVIKGANALLNPHNFAMYDYSTHQLFNISDYYGSYIAVSYPNSPQSVTNNLNIPEAELNLGGASMVTVWVSTYYYRTLLVPASASNTKPLKMFLSNPHYTVAYDIQVLDSSGRFNSTSTEVIITQGGVNITSGFLDSSYAFPVWLVPGTYTIEVYNPTNTAVFITSLNFGQVAATITLPIPNLITSTNCTSLICTVNNHNAVWSPDLKSIVWSYDDTSYSTTKLYTLLYITNATGTYLLQSSVLTNSPGFGSATGTFSCASDSCNTTLATQLSVEWLVTNEAGVVNETLGPVPLVISSFPAGTPNLPAFGGIDFLLPGISILSIFAILIVAITIGVFVIETAPFGFVIVAGEVVFFGTIGWIPNPLGGTVYGGLFIIAFVSFLRQRELRSQYP